MGSIPNGSAPLQACARQIFKSTLPGRTGKAQVYINIFTFSPLPAPRALRGRSPPIFPFRPPRPPTYCAPQCRLG